MSNVELMLTAICLVNTISLFLLNYRIDKIKKVLTVINMRWKMLLNVQYGLTTGDMLRRKIDEAVVDKL